jgi:uncharacterized membrane protein YccC
VLNAYDIRLGFAVTFLAIFWIITALSPVQADYKNTSRRFPIRLLSTIAGTAVFALLLGYILPEQYYFFVPLILGYMGCFSFIKKYRIQQFSLP